MLALKKELLVRTTGARGLQEVEGVHEGQDRQPELQRELAEDMEAPLLRHAFCRTIKTTIAPSVSIGHEGPQSLE